MTRISEALDRAEGERAGSMGGAPPDGPAPMMPHVSASPVEATMIGLYQGIHNALPDADSRVVTFVGATKSADASVLLTKFCQVVADRLDVQVLYVGVSQPKAKGLLALSGGPDGLFDGVEDEAALDSAILSVGDSGLHVARLFADGSDGTVAGIHAPGFERVLSALRARFALIVFDAPPADVAPDAFALASRSDGVVLVVEAERTRWQVADAVRARLEEQGGRILGAVLNKRRFYIPGWIYRRL